jgi:hypothetical protein
VNGFDGAKKDHPVRVITPDFSHQSIVDPDDPIDYTTSVRLSLRFPWKVEKEEAIQERKGNMDR